MNVFICTRHEGAKSWLLEKAKNLFPLAQRYKVLGRFPSHICNALTEKDVVIGTLPLAIAAAVCEAGARYISLSSPGIKKHPAHSELNREQFLNTEPYLIEYSIHTVNGREAFE